MCIYLYIYTHLYICIIYTHRNCKQRTKSNKNREQLSKTLKKLNSDIKFSKKSPNVRR